jgi:hypothetical protein
MFWLNHRRLSKPSIGDSVLEVAQNFHFFAARQNLALGIEVVFCSRSPQMPDIRVLMRACLTTVLIISFGQR